MIYRVSRWIGNDTLTGGEYSKEAMARTVAASASRTCDVTEVWVQVPPHPKLVGLEAAWMPIARFEKGAEVPVPTLADLEGDAA